MATGTKEIHFEAHIEKYLLEKEGYQTIDPSSYNKDLCIIPSEVIAFIKDTQPKQYKALASQYGASVDEKIVANIARNIQKNKTLNTLRKGVKDRGQKLTLAYFKPANNKTPELINQPTFQLFVIFVVLRIVYEIHLLLQSILMLHHLEIVLNQ